MAFENGTAIVLAYVVVSMGMAITFLVAVFVIGWFIDRLREAGANTGEKNSQSLEMP
jgi:uncharacterized membrane protein